MTILELREKRAKAWEAAKAFLDSHRKENGVLSAEDDAAYTKMEQEITDLGKEIARLERQEALDAELNRPVNKPLTGKPMNGKLEDDGEGKMGRASDEYKKNFWNAMRSKARCRMSPMPCRSARIPRAATLCRMNLRTRWWRHWRRRTSSARWQRSSRPPAVTARFP